MIGIWNGAELLLASYPETASLERVEAEAFDAIEVVRKRGAIVRFLTGPSLEFQAVLEPDARLVLYRDDMPAYEAVKAAAVAGPALYGLWPDAPADEDRHRIWSLDNGGGTVVSLAEATAGLRAARTEAALLPGLIALFGLALTLRGVRRWRAMART